MDGLVVAAAIWAIALTVVHTINRQDGRFASLRLNRAHLSLVFLMLATKSIVGSSSADEVLENPVALERAVRGGLAVLAAIIILPSLIAGVRRPGRAPIGVGMTALWFYLGVAAVSTVYSVAPVVTAGKVFELSVGVAIVAAVAMGPNPGTELRRLMGFLLFLEGTLIAVAVIGFFLVPSLFADVQPRPGFIFRSTLVAPYAHNNVLAAGGAAVAGFSLASAFRPAVGRLDRRWWLAAFGLFTAAVVLASGRQGVVIWIVTVGAVLFFTRRALFLGFLAPAAVFLVSQYWGTVWQAVNRDAVYDLRTLTGRLDWWSAAIEAWSRHPWTGFGFGAGGRFVALTAVGASTSNVHNGYLEALIGVGLIGFIPFLIALVRAIGWSWRHLRSRVDLRYAIVLIPIALRTTVDLGFGAWLKPDFILFAAIVALADVGRRATSSLSGSAPPDREAHPAPASV